jgi:hypothetical protein
MIICLVQNDKEERESERQRSGLERKAKRKEKHAREKDRGTYNKGMRAQEVVWIQFTSHTLLSPALGRYTAYPVDLSDARRLVGPEPTSSSECLPLSVCPVTPHVEYLLRLHRPDKKDVHVGTRSWEQEGYISYRQTIECLC